MLAIAVIGPIFIGGINRDFYDQGEPAISALPRRTLQRMVPFEIEHHVDRQCLTTMDTLKHPHVGADCLHIGAHVAAQYDRKRRDGLGEIMELWAALQRAIHPSP